MHKFLSGEKSDPPPLLHLDQGGSQKIEIAQKVNKIETNSF